MHRKKKETKIAVATNSYFISKCLAFCKVQLEVSLPEHLNILVENILFLYFILKAVLDHNKNCILEEKKKMLKEAKRISFDLRFFLLVSFTEN